MTKNESFSLNCNIEDYVKQHMNITNSSKSTIFILRQAFSGSRIHLYYICGWISQKEYKVGLMYLSHFFHYRNFIGCPSKYFSPLSRLEKIESKNPAAPIRNLDTFHIFIRSATLVKLGKTNLISLFNHFLLSPIESEKDLSDINKQRVQYVFNHIHQMWNRVFKRRK